MHLQDILTSLLKKWYFVLLLCAFFSLTVKYNTVVHPYLIADNRHFTFYLWNRFLGKPLARYLAIPLYVFGTISLFAVLENQNAGFKIVYFLCTTVSVALQSMIEVRYFLLPFLLIRLLYPEPIKFSSIAIELAFNSTINIATFYIFFTKTFYWSDYSEPQRIMW